MEIAPFRGLRYDLGRVGGDDPAGSVTAPPYDVISPEEHRRLLERSPWNITRITLGESPGAAASYRERALLLARWREENVLVREEAPCLYAYTIDYQVPGAGSGGRAAHFIGLIALGKLHELSAGVVLPHEETFPKVVEDRYRLLVETRTHLETIFLLHADPERTLDRLLEEAATGEPVCSVEAKPGEVHALHRIDDAETVARLQRLLAPSRPIIADGHHRYTTSLRYRREAGAAVPGSAWQLMTFANLYADGLSILATHRLVKLAAGCRAGDVIPLLSSRLEPGTAESWDLRVETTGSPPALWRFPDALRASRAGAARTSYGLLHEAVLGDWLAGRVAEGGVRYFKEGTGEVEALERGDGDLLFRLRPVARREFQAVVEAGDVFPHKTTYFYPKLWSGLVLWPLEEPAGRAPSRPA